MTDSRIKFVRLADLGRNLKGQQYLIKPFLELSKTGVIFGETGSYKSFICLDMALCVAHGKTYHGHRANQGPVFYVCGEGHDGINRRIEAWRIAHNLKEEDAHFYASDRPISLFNEEGAQELAQVIEDTCTASPALVVIDTLSTCMGEGNESSNPDIAKMLNNVNTHIRDRFGACVLIVHHTGHGNKDRERGASALKSNADFRILVKKGRGDTCTVENLKSKEDSPFKPIAFKASKVDIGIQDSEGDKVMSLVLDRVECSGAIKRTPQQEQALAVLQEMTTEKQSSMDSSGGGPESAGIKPPEWFDRLEELKILKEGSSRQNKNKLKKSLIDSGAIIEDGGYVSLAPADPDDVSLGVNRQPSVNQASTVNQWCCSTSMSTVNHPL